MTPTTVVPQWLQSTHITGLDQLGIQVISIALYSDLLPGLTNVTDRIRYYSFYPWLLHRYASDVKIVDETAWQDHLRRAEFLLALVGRLHHQEDREGGEALVGAEQATKAIADIKANPTKVWQLSQWSAVANAGQKDSYFKNKNGGFGQYYRGQLANLGLISFSNDSFGIKLTKGKGTEIAQICDTQNGRAEFWKAVIEDKFTLEKITAWGDCLCPCAVTRYKEECQFLVKLLFGQDSQGSDNMFCRAHTLRLLLAVLNQAGELDKPVTHFRSLAYYEHDANARCFRPPADLADVFHKWSMYETCELAHYTLEVSFDAILHHLSEVDISEADANRFVTNIAKAALRVTSSDLGLGTRKSKWCDRTLGDIVEEAQKRQKPLADWRDDPWAEANLLSDIAKQPPLIRLARAFACLLAIYARNRIPAQPFQAFSTITTDWLGRHKVNLVTIYKYFSERADGNAASVFSEFLKDYVVGQHFRVAMRKLRYDSQSTFKLAIEDGRFIWLQHFEPTQTNPRLLQSFRFLRDLGFCSGQSGGWKLSRKGKSRLRHADGN